MPAMSLKSLILLLGGALIVGCSHRVIYPDERPLTVYAVPNALPTPAASAPLALKGETVQRYFDYRPLMALQGAGASSIPVVELRRTHRITVQSCNDRHAIDLGARVVTLTTAGCY